jgi:hypothetical protein
MPFPDYVTYGSLDSYDQPQAEHKKHEDVHSSYYKARQIIYARQ